MTNNPALQHFFTSEPFTGTAHCKLPSLESMMQSLTQAKSVSSYMPERDMSNIGVIELLESWCNSLGMTLQRQEVSKGKYNLIAQLMPDDYDGTTQGLMFAGHTDTVDYLQEDWESDPFELKTEDNHWFGLGVCDMKGYFPLALYAIASQLEKHHKTGLSLKAPITLIATADEETTMAGVRALSSHTITPHQVIIGEPSNGQAIYAHKGVMTTKFILKGVRGHASNPGLGANAIEAAHWVMSRIIDWRQELLSNKNEIFKIPHPTFNFGCIHGGHNSNVICDQCELLLDMRLLPQMAQPAMELEMRQRLQGLEEAVPGTSLEIQTLDFSPAFQEDKTSKFAQLLQTATQSPLVTSNFVTEAAYLQQQGHMPFILGAGSIDWAHKPNERLDLFKAHALIDQLQACLEVLFRSY